MNVAATKLATGQCKGTLLVNLHSYLDDNGKGRIWSDLIAAAAPAEADVLRHTLLVSSWYPVGMWNRALRFYLATCGDRSAEMKRYANYVADRDLNTVMKFVLSIATPEMIVSRSGMFWSRYFDVGAVTPRKLGPQHWILDIAGPVGEDEGPAAVTCGDGVCGWVEQALRRSGAEKPRVVHSRCRFQGASECQSDVVW